MMLFKRTMAALRGSAPQDDMAIRYPRAAWDTAPNFSAYPPKVFLENQGIFAYRLEFAAFEADVARVTHALASEFDWPNAAPFQEGLAQRGDKSAHFSIRPEFGGSVVVMITNSVALIEKIDALHLEPPPPWMAFPDVDPSTLGDLQGAIEYWWDWLFSPFWNTLDDAGHASYLSHFAPHDDWAEFLSSHAR